MIARPAERRPTLFVHPAQVLRCSPLIRTQTSTMPRPPRFRLSHLLRSYRRPNVRYSSSKNNHKTQPSSTPEKNREFTAKSVAGEIAGNLLALVIFSEIARATGWRSQRGEEKTFQQLHPLPKPMERPQVESPEAEKKESDLWV